MTILYKNCNILCKVKCTVQRLLDRLLRGFLQISPRVARRRPFKAIPNTSLAQLYHRQKLVSRYVDTLVTRMK